MIVTDWSLEIISFDHYYNLDSIARLILQGLQSGNLRDGFWTLERGVNADLFRIYNAVKQGKTSGLA